MKPLNNPDIEKYLLGKLRGAKLKAFEEQLQNDPEMAKEVNLRKELIAQVEGLGALEMKEQLLEIKKNLEGRRRMMIRRTLGLVAAAAVALLVFGVQFMNGEVNPQGLYDTYYSAYDLPFASRAEGNDSLLGEAGKHYQGKDYAQALPVLEEVLRKNPKDSRSRLALGISQLEQGQLAAAQDTFAHLIDTNDSLYLDQARWYTALIYLQQEKLDDCRKQLIFLSANPRAPHYEQAQVLLQELE